MNTYKGLKSTDAEIFLDLNTGKAFFDYSLNKFGHFWDSNKSCVLSKSGKIKINILEEIETIFAPFIILASLFIQQHIASNYQYSWQRFLKWFYTIRNGIEIQTSVGKLLIQQKTFHISNNIWIGYELDGDYNKQIKEISLVRHFSINEQRGITYHKQNGWDVIFDFNEPPQDGHLILKSIV